MQTYTGSVKILPGQNTDLLTFRLPKITLGSAHHGQNTYGPKVQAVKILTGPKPIRRSKYLRAQIVKILAGPDCQNTCEQIIQPIEIREGRDRQNTYAPSSSKYLRAQSAKYLWAQVVNILIRPKSQNTAGSKY